MYWQSRVTTDWACCLDALNSSATSAGFDDTSLKEKILELWELVDMPEVKLLSAGENEIHPISVSASDASGKTGADPNCLLRRWGYNSGGEVTTGHQLMTSNDPHSIRAPTKPRANAFGRKLEDLQRSHTDTESTSTELLEPSTFKTTTKLTT